MLDVALDHDTRTLDLDRLRAVLDASAAGEGRETGEVTVVLTDHATVRELNVAHLGHDYDTDVLSFWLGADDGSGALEGEVYVDLDTAAERCGEFGSDYEREAMRYAVHGLLHLCGYDDADDADRETMRGLEDCYLDLPFTNP